MSQTLLKTLADFNVQLASAVSIGATTATLSSATDDDGVALPTGTYGLTIDAGNSSKEYITCTLTSTALTNVVSISRQGASTTGFVRAHRRGAKVTLTDWATLSRILNLLNGTTNFDSGTPLGYDGAPSITTGNQFATKTYTDTQVATKVGLTGNETVAGIKTFSSSPIVPTPTTDFQASTKKYVDDAVVSGSPDASTTVKGIVEEATQAEVDAGTAVGGTGARLFINPSTLRTSDVQIFTANGTWTKPTNAKTVQVVCIGAGGGGGSGTSTSSALNVGGGSGGGGGSVSTIILDASSVGATVSVTVGSGGVGGAQVSGNTNGNNGGNGTESTFGNWLRASGGGGGLGNSASAVTGGGGASTLTNASGFTGGTPTTTNTASLSGQGITPTTGNADGLCSEWGGASGGGAPGSGVNDGKAGGSSIFAAPGGGGGGSASGSAGGNGGAGGTTMSYTAGGGSSGGTGGVGSGVAGGNGTAGVVNATLDRGYAGSGGGGGGGAYNENGGTGGAGAIGSGGGGGGASFATGAGWHSGAGGDGGRGEVRVYTYF